jgi:hypothetical protein
VYVGRDPLSGRKLYRTKTVRSVGKREAERLLAALVAAEDAPVSGTFGELVPLSAKAAAAIRDQQAHVRAQWPNDTPWLFPGS